MRRQIQLSCRPLLLLNRPFRQASPTENCPPGPHNITRAVPHVTAHLHLIKPKTPLGGMASHPSWGDGIHPSWGDGIDVLMRLEACSRRSACRGDLSQSTDQGICWKKRRSHRGTCPGTSWPPWCRRGRPPQHHARRVHGPCCSRQRQGSKNQPQRSKSSRVCNPIVCTQTRLDCSTDWHPSSKLCRRELQSRLVWAMPGQLLSA